MKRIFIFFIIFSITKSNSAQMFEREGGNIGLIVEGGLPITIAEAQKATGNLAYSAGITTSLFNDIVYPELTYVGGIRNFSSIGQNYTENLSAIRPGILIKVPALTFSTGKSKHYECRAWNFHLVGGYAHLFHINKNQTSTQDANLVMGINLLPTKSGGAKSVQAKAFNFDVLYYLDLNKDNSFSFNSQTGWKTNYLSFRITLMIYKTYDFLGIR